MDTIVSQLSEAGSSSSAAPPAAAKAESPRRKQFFPPDKSVYTTSLRGALEAAAAATAANGERLFAPEEHALLGKLRGLDAASLQLLSRLIFTGKLWQQQKFVEKHCERPAEAVDALVAAGAAVTFSPSVSRAFTLEMLPFVHGKHVHATAVKVKDAAQAEAKAAGAKLRTLRDDEKGSSKAKNLTRITNLCAEYPGVQLEQLVAEALATPLPKAEEEGQGRCRRRRRGGGRRRRRRCHRQARPRGAGGGAAGLPRAAAVRAHDGADGAAAAAVHQGDGGDAPRGAAAPAVGRGERRARAVCEPPPLRGGRGGDRVWRRAALRVHRRRRGHRAPQPEGVCREVAQGGARRVQAMRRRRRPRPAARPPDARRRGAGGARALPEDALQACDVARKLAEAAIPLLEAYAASDDAAYARAARVVPAARRRDAARARRVGGRAAARAGRAEEGGGRAAAAVRRGVRPAAARAALHRRRRRRRRRGASQGAAGVGGPGAEAGDAFTIADGDGSQMEGIDEHVAADDGRDVRGRCHVHLLRDLKHLAKLRGAEGNNAQREDEEVQRALAHARAELPRGGAARWDAEASAGDRQPLAAAAEAKI